MTNTELQMLATFKSAVVPLDDICEKYFGLSRNEARRAAALHRLPVPVWRSIESKRAPLMVRVSDLAAAVDRIAEAAAREHEKSQL